MEIPGTNILQVILFLMWLCLCQPVTQNPVFKTVFFDQRALTEIANLAALTMCPGLFEVIRAASPPAFAWFKALPEAVLRLWGIYLIILEKHGCTPLIYIGSATEVIYGFESRFKVYNGDPYVHSLPYGVQKALLDGYKITHKKLLVTCPIPAAHNVPRVRLLIVLLEAAHTFVFWSVLSRTKDYGIGACYPWTLDQLPDDYQGINTHNPLTEGPRGNFDLTPEQLEAMLAQSNEDRTSRKLDKYQEQVALDPYGVKEFDRDKSTIWREKNPEKAAMKAADYFAENPEVVRANQARYRQRQKTSMKFWCDPCSTNSTHQAGFDRHLNFPDHKRNVERVAAGRQLENRCYICGKSFDKWYVLRDHNKSIMHMKRAAEPGALEAAAAAKIAAKAEQPAAIKAAKAAIRACMGDFSKAIVKFNNDPAPVPEHQSLIIDWKQVKVPKPAPPVALAPLPNYDFTKSVHSAFQQEQVEGHPQVETDSAPAFKYLGLSTEPSLLLPPAQQLGLRKVESHSQVIPTASAAFMEELANFSATSDSITDKPKVAVKRRAPPQPEPRKSKSKSSVKSSVKLSPKPDLKTMSVKKEYKPTVQTKLFFGLKPKSSDGQA